MKGPMAGPIPIESRTLTHRLTSIKSSIVIVSMVEFNVIWTCSAHSGTTPAKPATTAAACLCRLGRCLSRSSSSSPRGSCLAIIIQYNIIYVGIVRSRAAILMWLFYWTLCKWFEIRSLDLLLSFLAFRLFGFCRFSLVGFLFCGLLFIEHTRNYRIDWVLCRYWI